MSSLDRRTFLAAGFAGLIGLHSIAQAAGLAPPAGEPILKISGAIQNTNVDGAALFDRAMLEKLGTVTVRTTTPWHDGVVTFEGVSLRTLMAEVGASGTDVTATALNDYSSTLPISDFETFDVILAMKKDGQPMPVRDKGPLFIVYPYDSDPALRSNDYYSRSVWQVKELLVR